jgi:hypothetical protein
MEERALTLDEFLEKLTQRHSGRIIDTWLREFGYTQGQPSTMKALRIAAFERGSRLAKELRVHAQRLVDRAQMEGPRRITGEASVIR